MEINEMKSYIRDMNLDILMNCPNFNIDISKRWNNRFRLFYPSRKLIKYITKIGGVLTGSRAIRCFTINGKPILSRKVQDWDFVVTLDMAFKICDEMKINEIPRLGETISIKNQRMWRHPDYSDSYRVGPVDVQIIIKESLPDYIDVGGLRISNFANCISHKIEIASEYRNAIINRPNISVETKEQYKKHINDLKELIIKFNTSKIL
jgi:hypothetical protein